MVAMLTRFPGEANTDDAQIACTGFGRLINVSLRANTKAGKRP